MHTPFTLARTVQVLLLAVVSGASVTALQAQSHEVATAIELQGQVWVLRSGQVALFQNSTVKPKEEIFTGADGYAKFQIGDGSTFEVFPKSHVIFQAQWTIEDMLQLILGKIRVEIEHRNGPNPKKVSTPTAVISVRGTIFDVSVEDDDGTTLVSVEQGQVQVQHLLQPGPSKILNEDESIRIYPNRPIAKLGGTSPAIQILWDRVKGIAADVLLRNPGGLGWPGGSAPGTSGGPQGSTGKTKKPPPTTAPAPGGGL